MVVHPLTQIVVPIVAWVTAGLLTPGVRAAFGKIAVPTITSEPVVAAGSLEGSGVGEGAVSVAVDVATGLPDWDAGPDVTPFAEQPVSANATTARASRLLFMSER